jgi:hypothetical protein
MQFTQCHPYRLWPCMTATMVRYLCVNNRIMYQHVSPGRQAQLAQVVALLKPQILFIGLVCVWCCIIWYCAARVAYVVYFQALRSHVPLYLALASHNVRARFRCPGCIKCTVIRYVFVIFFQQHSVIFNMSIYSSCIADNSWVFFRLMRPYTNL